MCWAISPQKLAGHPLDLPIVHLKDFDEGVISGQLAFFKMRTGGGLSPRQFTQDSPYGELYGYAYYQHFSFASTYDSGKDKPRLGIHYAYARKGWNRDDFFLISDEEFGSQHRSSHMGGLYYSSYYPGLWLAGLGYAWQNENKLSFGVPSNSQDDHLVYSVLQYRWFSGSVLFAQKLQAFHLLYFGEERIYDPLQEQTWQSYLPRLGVSWRRDSEKWAIEWEQNLYNRNLYVESEFDPQEARWNSSTMVFYFDPSRFFWTAFSLYNADDHLLWGWNLKLAMFEIGYQYAPDLVQGLPWRGSWRAGFSIGIASLINKTFRSPSASINLKEVETRK